MPARCTRYPPDLGGDTGRPDSHRSRSRMAFCVWPGVGPVNCGERRRAVGACGLRAGANPGTGPPDRSRGCPVGASRALPAVASHAIGYADSGLAAHSRGSRRLRGRREESRNGWSPGTAQDGASPLGSRSVTLTFRPRWTGSSAGPADTPRRRLGLRLTCDGAAYAPALRCQSARC